MSGNLCILSFPFSLLHLAYTVDEGFGSSYGMFLLQYLRRILLDTYRNVLSTFGLFKTTESLNNMWRHDSYQAIGLYENQPSVCSGFFSAVMIVTMKVEIKLTSCQCITLSIVAGFTVNILNTSVQLYF